MHYTFTIHLLCLGSNLPSEDPLLHIYSSHKPCTIILCMNGNSSMFGHMNTHLNTPHPHRGQKVVLHDRPPRHFHRATPQEMHEVG